MFRTLQRLFCRRTPSDSTIAILVLVYTRRLCHLCDDALQELALAGQRFPLDIRTVDIDTDPMLVAQYDTCVPVVFIDHKERFRGKVNRVLLQRLLENSGRPEKTDYTARGRV